MSQLYEKITTKTVGSCCPKQEKRSPDSSQQQIHDQQPPKCGLGSFICKELPNQENHQQVAQDTDSNKVPRNYREILSNSDLDLLHRPLFITSDKMIIQHLLDGVFLSDKKRFYWVDKKKNNCFKIFPNDLTITSPDNKKCLNLQTAQTSDLGKITVAKLQPGVKKLEISGGINAEYLSPGVKYQVEFVILLEYTSYGWEDDLVSVTLKLPNEKIQERKESFKDKSRGEWLRIPVRNDGFEVPPGITGEIEFSLYQNGNTSKKGLIIKSVNIEAKYSKSIVRDRLSLMLTKDGKC